MSEGVRGSDRVCESVRVCECERVSESERVCVNQATRDLRDHNDLGVGRERFDQELEGSETGLETGRLCARCDLLCGRCVLVAASVAAAEVMVAEVIAKLKEVGLTVGAEKTHWTSHPKDDGHKH